LGRGKERKKKRDYEQKKKKRQEKNLSHNHLFIRKYIDS